MKHEMNTVTYQDISLIQLISGLCKENLGPGQINLHLNIFRVFLPTQGKLVKISKKELNLPTFCLQTF